MIRSHHRLRFAMVTMAAGALVLAACGSSKSSSSGSSSGGKTVALGSVGALTGDSANLGINIRNGAKLAVDQYNAGNPKVKVTLKEFDTAGDPAQASTLKDKFVNDSAIIALVGPAFSGET